MVCKKRIVCKFSLELPPFHLFCLCHHLHQDFLFMSQGLGSEYRDHTCFFMH